LNKVLEGFPHDVFKLRENYQLGDAGRKKQQVPEGCKARQKAQAARLGQGAQGRVAEMHLRNVWA
jgi:hypothetical protein